MKILLLTDIPPCREWTAGLVLDQLCRFLPEKSISCFVARGFVEDANVTEDLQWIPTQYARGPSQCPPQLPDRWWTRPANRTVSWLLDRASANVHVRSLVRQAVAFGQNQHVDLVWGVLQGQTMIRLVRPVAEALGAPLVTQVYDPPQWWLRHNRIDPLSARSILRVFDDTLRSSACCAAASWQMADEYQATYGVPCVPLIPSLDPKLGCRPTGDFRHEGRLVLALAGQVYASAEWRALLNALDCVDWRIANREVSIRLLGRSAQLHTDRGMRIEFLGWRKQSETIQLLSEADILYCPYWFDAAFEREARLSFPSKLTSYLAAGRPALFHGPDYASPARFLKDHRAGMCCHSLESRAILDVLEKLTTDMELRQDLARHGSEAFRRHLTLDSYRDCFRQFLQADEQFLLPVALAEPLAE